MQICVVVVVLVCSLVLQPCNAGRYLIMEAHVHDYAKFHMYR